MEMDNIIYYILFDEQYDFSYLSDEIDESYTFEKMKGFINGKQ